MEVGGGRGPIIIAICALVVAVAAHGGGIAFNRSELTNTNGAALLSAPTSLQFGPDGRLYVGQQDGLVHALSLIHI